MLCRLKPVSYRYLEYVLLVKSSVQYVAILDVMCSMFQQCIQCAVCVQYVATLNVVWIMLQCCMQCAVCFNTGCSVQVGRQVYFLYIFRICSFSTIQCTIYGNAGCIVQYVSIVYLVRSMWQDWMKCIVCDVAILYVVCSRLHYRM